MDPELLKYLANMTSEQLAAYLRSVSEVGGLDAHPAVATKSAFVGAPNTIMEPATFPGGGPWATSPDFKVGMNQPPLPVAALQTADSAAFGNAQTAIRPSTPGVSGLPGILQNQSLATPPVLQNQPLALPNVLQNQPLKTPMDQAALLRNQPLAGAPRVPSPLRVPVPAAEASLTAVHPMQSFGIGDLIQADRPGAEPLVPQRAPLPRNGPQPIPPPPKLQSLPIPELPGEPLPTPRGAPPAASPPSADFAARPAIGSAPGSSLRASALMAEPSILPQPVPAQAPPVAAAGAPVRPAPMPAAPPAAPAPMPQVAGNRIMGVAEAQARFGVGFAEAARIANGEVPLPAGRAPMPGAPPAPVHGSLPQLPGMSGISQVEGAFGAGQSAQADALRQYLAGRGGQPGLAGAASGAGMGSPIPTPGSVPGVPGTAPGVPPPTTQAMPTPSAATPAPTTGAAGGAAPAASRFSKVLGAVRPALRGVLGTAGTAATVYGLAKDAGNLAGKALDARDPSLSPIENFGRGVAAVGSEVAPLVMPQAQPTREEMLTDPAGTLQRAQLANAGGNVPLFRYMNPAAVATTSAQALGGLAEQAINWAITRPGAERFQDTQPGTAATIRAAMAGGQSRGAPAFDMGNPKPADPGATPPAPAVRPATPGGGQRKRPAAPAIPPSPETGVSGGSPGAGSGPYKLLDKKLSVPMVENMQASPSPTAVRPGGPEGSWRDKGYTAMLNDKRGVVGEGWRTPLREGPGGGASFNRGIADRGLFSGKLSQAVPPDPSLNMGSAPSMPDAAGLAVRPSLPKSQEGENGIYAPIGGMDEELEEDEEDKRARLARSGPRQFSPRFLSPQ